VQGSQQQQQQQQPSFAFAQPQGGGYAFSPVPLPQQQQQQQQPNALALYPAAATTQRANQDAISTFLGVVAGLFQLFGILRRSLARAAVALASSKGAPMLGKALHNIISTLSEGSSGVSTGGGKKAGLRMGQFQRLEKGRFLFVCGGKSLATNTTMSTMHVFDKNTGGWGKAPDMLRPRVSARAAVVNGELYVVGGWDGSQVLSSVERFDQSQGRWFSCGTMGTPRASPALAILNGFLYAIGGFDGRDWLSSVERYDPGKDAWEV
jgi:hypothetical protein